MTLLPSVYRDASERVSHESVENFKPYLRGEEEGNLLPISVFSFAKIRSFKMQRLQPGLVSPNFYPRQWMGGSLRMKGTQRGLKGISSQTVDLNATPATHCLIPAEGKKMKPLSAILFQCPLLFCQCGVTTGLTERWMVRSEPQTVSLCPSRPSSAPRNQRFKKKKTLRRVTGVGHAENQILFALHYSHPGLRLAPLAPLKSI